MYIYKPWTISEAFCLSKKLKLFKKIVIKKQPQYYTYIRVNRIKKMF